MHRQKFTHWGRPLNHCRDNRHQNRDFIDHEWYTPRQPPIPKLLPYSHLFYRQVPPPIQPTMNGNCYPTRGYNHDLDFPSMRGQPFRSDFSIPNPPTNLHRDRVQLNTRPRNPYIRPQLEKTRSDLSKDLFRSSQTRVHFKNWSTTPRYIKNHVDTLFDHLCPPAPDEEFKKNRDTLRLNTIKEITNLTKAHIIKTFEVTKRKICDSAKTPNLTNCRNETIENLNERFGKKFNKKLLSTWVDADLSLVGRGSSSLEPPPNPYRIAHSSYLFCESSLMFPESMGNTVLKTVENVSDLTVTGRKIPDPNDTRMTTNLMDTSSGGAPTASVVVVPPLEGKSNLTSRTPDLNMSTTILPETKNTEKKLIKVNLNPMTNSPRPQRLTLRKVVPNPNITPPNKKSKLESCQVLTHNKFSPLLIESDVEDEVPITAPPSVYITTIYETPKSHKKRIRNRSEEKIETKNKIEQKLTTVLGVNFMSASPVKPLEGKLTKLLPVRLCTSAGKPFSIPLHPKTLPYNTFSRSYNHFTHLPAHKDFWTITPKPDTHTLIVGDSNLKYCSLPKHKRNLEVHSFPGGNFYNILKVFDNFDDNISKQIKTLIIVLGINHRDDNPLEVKEPIERLKTKMSKFDTFYLAEISFGNYLTNKQIQNVTSLNGLFDEVFGSRDVIPRVDQNLVCVAPTDIYRIHHDVKTATLVMKNILDFLFRISPVEGVT